MSKYTLNRPRSALRPAGTPPCDPQFGHRRHGRGGRSGLSRCFAHGDLRPVILHLIAEKPQHGYEIIKAIEERGTGAYSPSPGVIYPTVTPLEEVGHVTVSPGDSAKKLHAITPEGRACLDALCGRPIPDRLGPHGRDRRRQGHAACRRGFRVATYTGYASGNQN